MVHTAHARRWRTPTRKRKDGLASRNHHTIAETGFITIAGSRRFGSVGSNVGICVVVLYRPWRGIMTQYPFEVPDVPICKDKRRPTSSRVYPPNAYRKLTFIASTVDAILHAHQTLRGTGMPCCGSLHNTAAVNADKSCNATAYYERVSVAKMPFPILVSQELKTRFDSHLLTWSLGSW